MPDEDTQGTVGYPTSKVMRKKCVRLVVAFNIAFQKYFLNPVLRSRSDVRNHVHMVPQSGEHGHIVYVFVLKYVIACKLWHLRFGAALLSRTILQTVMTWAFCPVCR